MGNTKIDMDYDSSDESRSLRAYSIYTCCPIQDTPTVTHCNSLSLIGQFRRVIVLIFLISAGAFNARTIAGQPGRMALVKYLNWR